MSAPSPDRTSDRHPAQADVARDPVAAPLALLLWILVVAALTYGVWSTLGKVVKLFG